MVETGARRKEETSGARRGVVGGSRLTEIWNCRWWRAAQRGDESVVVVWWWRKRRLEKWMIVSLSEICVNSALVNWAAMKGRQRRRLILRRDICRRCWLLNMCSVGGVPEILQFAGVFENEHRLVWLSMAMGKRLTRWQIRRVQDQRLIPCKELRQRVYFTAIVLIQDDSIYTSMKATV